MSPKEKAKNLYLDYIGIFQESNMFNVGDNLNLITKVCCYNTINFLTSNRSCDDSSYLVDGKGYDFDSYWREVKSEIEQM